jgi:hypothetical protein
VAKKCKYCGNHFVPKYSSLETYCQDDDCRYKYAIEVLAKKKEAEKKKIAKQWKTDKAVLKEKIKGIPELKKDLEREINKICCLIDLGSGCISCNGHTTPQCGHYHSVNSNGSIRYNLDNLHLQDYSCNSAKGGNIHKYDLGLIDRYGKQYWEYVKFELVEKYPYLKMTISEYKEKILIARRIVKWLQLQEKKYTPKERLSLRKKYNNEIGIYI